MKPSDWITKRITELMEQNASFIDAQAIATIQAMDLYFSVQTYIPAQRHTPEYEVSSRATFPGRWPGRPSQSIMRRANEIDAAIANKTDVPAPFCLSGNPLSVLRALLEHLDREAHGVPAANGSFDKDEKSLLGLTLTRHEGEGRQWRTEFSDGTMVYLDHIGGDHWACKADLPGHFSTSLVTGTEEYVISEVIRRVNYLKSVLARMTIDDDAGQQTTEDMNKWQLYDASSTEPPIGTFRDIKTIDGHILRDAERLVDGWNVRFARSTQPPARLFFPDDTKTIAWWRAPSIDEIKNGTYDWSTNDVCS